MKLKKIILFIPTLIKAIPSLKFNCLTPLETIEYAIKHNKSIIRWGDGETNIACGRSNHRQNPNKELQKFLNDLLDDYSENSSYILAMPGRYIQCSFLSLSKHEMVFWSRSRAFLRKKIKASLIYGDSFTFRDVITGNNNMTYDVVKSLWEKYNTIIAVHSNSNIDRLTASMFSDKELINVLIPEKNAFLHYEEIENRVMMHIEELSKNNKNFAFVLGGSFTTKVLGLKLIKSGFRIFDIGILMKPEPLYIKLNLPFPG